MIKETKHYLLDQDLTFISYIVRRIYYKLAAPLYKMKLKMNTAPFVVKKYYVSICAIFKNEAPYLKEWIEYHKIVGIEHFFLYNNFSEDDYLLVLQPYITEGLVTLIDWPINQGQMGAYEDCTLHYGDESNWIAFIDLDEFIVPNEELSVKSILKKFEKRPAIVCYWKYFTTSGHINRNLRDLVTENFVVCARKYSNIGKIFFNTAYDWAGDDKHNTAMHSHWSEYRGRKLPPVNIFDKIFVGGVEDTLSSRLPMQINHYVTRSYNEYMKKLNRGDAYFANNPRSLDYFYIHEHMGESVDYNIFKYLLQLKIVLEEENAFEI